MNELRAHARPLLTFCVIGVVNTLAYYVVYLSLVHAIPYLVAHVIGWIVGICVSYFLNCRFTYHVAPTWRRFLMYPLSNLPNIILSSAGVVLMVEVFHWDKRIAPLIATLLAIPASYMLARIILVGSHRIDPDPSSEPGLVDQPDSRT